MGRYFTGGAGPRHSDLTAVFMRTGYDPDDPYVEAEGTPSKEVRVRAVLAAAVRRPGRARELVEGLLAEMRAVGCFNSIGDQSDRERVAALQRAFRRVGWELTEEAELLPVGIIDVATGGRAALDDQLARLRRATDDPALLLGTAKDLLETVAKFVLEEVGFPYRDGAEFGELWYLARERLGIHPKDIDASSPGGSQMRRIVQSTWTIAESVNELRQHQGTGHGRTLPTGVTPSAALLVVREACIVAEFTLNTLDRQLGR